MSTKEVTACVHAKGRNAIATALTVIPASNPYGAGTKLARVSGEPYG